MKKHARHKWVVLCIERWLKAPAQDEQGRLAERGKGTPRGGVASPLPGNLYLHWFDALFHGPGGPSRWAGAKLVRYADDLVVLAKQMSPETSEYFDGIATGKDATGST